MAINDWRVFLDWFRNNPRRGLFCLVLLAVAVFAEEKIRQWAIPAQRDASPIKVESKGDNSPNVVNNEGKVIRKGHPPDVRKEVFSIQQTTTGTGSVAIAGDGNIVDTN